MKLLGYILAFYVLGLAAVPCCLVDNCPDDKAGQSATHENRDEDCGSCSPFFSCEGCAAATVAYEPFQFELKAFTVKPVFTIYLQPYLPQTEFDFWQPPKLS